MNELQEKIESTIVTKTFHVSGMPLSIWKDVDSFCKEFYGDSRWVMISDLIKMAKDDYKYSLLQKEIEGLALKIAQLEQLQSKPVEPDKKAFKGFGEK